MWLSFQYSQAYHLDQADQDNHDSRAAQGHPMEKQYVNTKDKKEHFKISTEQPQP